LVEKLDEAQNALDGKQEGNERRGSSIMSRRRREKRQEQDEEGPEGEGELRNQTAEV
jgi:hypothetical protein